MSFIHKIQHHLDGIAMYRTVTIGLIILVACSLFLGATGELAYTFAEQLWSLLVAIAVGMSLNVAFAGVLKVPANHESAFITALILFFLVIPAFDLAELWQIAAITAVAIASKFILVNKRQHIFNAAAFGAFFFSIQGNFDSPLYIESGWWVATPQLFLPLLIVGTLVVMKIRKWTPVLWFLGVGFVVYVFEAWRLDLGAIEQIPLYFTSWPALFLAFFMLTEPFTMPPTKKLQAAYGALVGVLMNAAVFAEWFVMSPELALVVGNAVFWPATLRQKLYLPLKSKAEIAKGTWEFIFDKPAEVRFTAGQYLEWTLPHEKSDSRGLRRYFTIASAPEEPVLRLALRYEGEESSSYKQALMDMEPGDEIIASQRAGDFLWPADADTKLGLIAGGIGITPFRSHLESHRDSAIAKHATLYYCNNTFEDIAYKDYFDTYAADIGTKIVHVLSKEERPGYETGYLNADIIKRNTPDYLERTWYISGSPGLVNAAGNTLTSLGVPKKQIVKDFFPGLA
jgi:ferredoxin-NADP reductase/Na+-translocating ferredoxin:NAD+ oxidoreductase RnfD subunit